MNYLEFKKRVEKYPLITSTQLQFIKEDPQLVRNQITRWQKKGLILKLRRGIYILNESDRKINPSKLFLANQLYFPSYVSCEYALGFYELIPEKVIDITSVTPQKTYRIKNSLGVFIYQHIKTSAFRGFTTINDENGFKVFIAQPEKAIVDFFYLNLHYFKDYDSDIFEVSFRFQNLEILKKNKLFEFARYFDNKKLEKVVKDFCKFLNEHA